MSILELQRRFADEAACPDYLAMSRGRTGSAALGAAAAGHGCWRGGICGSALGDLGPRGHDHGSTHLPLRLWFWSAYLMATHAPGISAVQPQRQLGISRYETACFILHKLRRAMIAPERGLLTGEAEVDEAFVGCHNCGRCWGRDRTGKALVTVAVDVLGAGSERIRLQALPNANGDTLLGFVKATITPAAIVHTDTCGPECANASTDLSAFWDRGLDAIVVELMLRLASGDAGAHRVAPASSPTRVTDHPGRFRQPGHSAATSSHHSQTWRLCSAGFRPGEHS